MLISLISHFAMYTHSEVCQYNIYKIFYFSIKKQKPYIYILFLFWDSILLCSPGCPQTHHMNEAGFQLAEILLHRWVLAHSAGKLFFLRFKRQMRNIIVTYETDPLGLFVRQGWPQTCCTCQVWPGISIILVLGRLRQSGLEARLGNTVSFRPA